MIEMLRRYWPESVLFFTVLCCWFLLVVSSFFVFFAVLLIMEWSPEKNEILINMYCLCGQPCFSYEKLGQFCVRRLY